MAQVPMSIPKHGGAVAGTGLPHHVLGILRADKSDDGVGGWLVVGMTIEFVEKS